MSELLTEMTERAWNEMASFEAEVKIIAGRQSFKKYCFPAPESSS